MSEKTQKAIDKRESAKVIRAKKLNIEVPVTITTTVTTTAKKPDGATG